MKVFLWSRRPNMSVFLRPLASSCVWFFVIDGLRTLFFPVHVLVSAHWFLLLEFLCGAHMVRAAGETVYVLLVYVCSAALIAAPLHAALGGPAHVIFREGFAALLFSGYLCRDACRSFCRMFCSVLIARPGLGVQKRSSCMVLYPWFVFSTPSICGVLGMFPGKAPVFCSLEDCCPR